MTACHRIALVTFAIPVETDPDRKKIATQFRRTGGICTASAVPAAVALLPPLAVTT
jgi:hypothetical protein